MQKSHLIRGSCDRTKKKAKYIKLTKSRCKHAEMVMLIGLNVPLHTREVYTPLGGVGVAQTAAAVQTSMLPTTGQPVQGKCKALLPATEITSLSLHAVAFRGRYSVLLVSWFSAVGVNKLHVLYVTEYNIQFQRKFGKEWKKPSPILAFQYHQRRRRNLGRPKHR